MQDVINVLSFYELWHDPTSPGLLATLFILLLLSMILPPGMVEAFWRLISNGSGLKALLDLVISFASCGSEISGATACWIPTSTWPILSITE